ncbi:serine protease [Paenibacillus thiaminolyticus]|uniref:Serine protease n=1 Tax=Paenibacillus thiaminolyticus TaxID=49283 RepID=A0A3A3GCL1_PANTH|nr:serine protease [Paenibacillus thiaminolyticus]RJG21138.1 serine protease [Paenibacillus thiaminolyticus]
MKRTPAVAAWTTLMLLLLASPAAAEAGSANEAAQWQPFGQVVSDIVQPANAADKGSSREEADTDKELEQIKTQMQELRQQMKSLHEKKIQLLAKKHGIATEGKTSKQIRQELREKLGKEGRLFHEKHRNMERHGE